MKKLPKYKYQDIFFSPHFDDVVLSCGGTICANKKPLVVTVFSSHGKRKISRYARKYLQFCGFQNSKGYFNSRKKEDRKAAKILKYDTSWLGFPEAIFRFKKKFFFDKFFYNDLKSLLGKIKSEDKEILEKIREKVEKIINSYSNKETKLYFPLGIGNHVDHQLLNQIGFEINQNNQLNIKGVFFYEDFPYILGIDRKKLEKFLSKRGLKLKKIRLDKKQIKLKYQAILSYNSQIKPLFETQENFKKQFFKYHQKSYENYWQFT